jgi:hypothetical protein
LEYSVSWCRGIIAGWDPWREKMVKKKVEMPTCDVLVDGKKCGHIATEKCAKCKCDLCDEHHTHDYGDGGHMEHAIPVVTAYFPYAGDMKFFLCPKCFIDTGLKDMVDGHGKRVEGTGGYHAGDSMG